MVFPIAGGTQDTSYEISNSLRFNDDDSPALQFTPSSDSNEQTWTVSFWVKRSNLTTSSSQMIFCSDTNYTEYVYCRFNGTEVTGKADMFEVFLKEPNSRTGTVRTARLFRDVSAWYHIVVRCDLTQSTAADRLRIYVNGVKETSFDTASYLNQNDDNINWNSNVPQAIGHQKQAGTTERFFDGYISEFYNIDGTSLAPTEFGETNDNGVWIPKQYTGSYGTNGFFLEFQGTGTSQNSSGIGADTSGNDNHFAVTNLAATDVTTDTPTNNFCILNALHKSTSDVVLSEGNLKMVSGYASGWQHAAGTMAVQNGKWYWEAKATTVSASDKTSAGVLQFDTSDVDFIGNTNTDRSSKGISGHGAGTGSYSYSQGDIIMCAMDIDNNKIYWGKNGTFFGTLDPANGTGSTTQTIDNNNFCVPAVGGYGGSTWEMNFGVPQFSISSGNADANGYGNFEYAVPSGFYSLCTKNLAEYG